MPIIEVQKLTKRYRADRRTRFLFGRGGLREVFGNVKPRTITAVENISFALEPGESLGIIGANGSGKSTLLRLIAGVTMPTSGEVRVRGRVASLLELGAGFHPMLTGRENVYLNGGILGLSHRDVDDVFDRIVAFSGVENSIDQPVDTYSSGMYVRLAFATAMYSNPDIYLVDEVLSVGDEAFQRKCKQRLAELMEEGKTLVFVSHDLGVVNTLCNRAILLSDGQAIAHDSPRKTIDLYLRQIGPQKGTYRVKDSDRELVVSNGQISLFEAENDITGPGGLQCQVMHMGRWRRSVDADWSIESQDESGCVARGRLHNMSASLVWRVSFDQGQVVWNAAIDCLEDISLDSVEFNLLFSDDYSRWYYEDRSGEFPELAPEDTEWTPLMGPDLLCDKAALLPAVDSGYPAVIASVSSPRPRFRGYWMNTDYMKRSRVFRVEEHGAESGIVLPKGQHDLAEFRFELVSDPGILKTGPGYVSSRFSLADGPLLARFDRGSVRVSYEGRPITAGLHMYASLLIGGLWNDSQNLRWESLTRQDGRLILGGRSRRFPFGLEWNLGLTAKAVEIQLWLEASEALDVQEYHCSILLDSAYDTWKTEHESGSFPEIGPEDFDWRHINENYAPGSFAEASGKGFPSVKLEVGADQVPCTMTALNTDFHMGARVLQALSTPQHAAFHLSAGRHLLFSGRLLVSGE